MDAVQVIIFGGGIGLVMISLHSKLNRIEGKVDSILTWINYDDHVGG